MRKLFLLLVLPVMMIWACKNENKKPGADAGKDLAAILGNYWEERQQLFPLDATSNGDNRYNDRLTITIAQSFRDGLARFYKRYLDEVSKIDSSGLDKNDLVSY